MSDPTGAPTLADLVSEIMDDLDRPDLEPQIRRGIAAAIRRHKGDRFGFNEAPFTFQTIPGADVYSSGDASEIPGLLAIDGIVLIDDNQTVELVRVPETWIEAVDQPDAGSMPTRYSYFGRTLRLWPMPSAAWTIRVTAHVDLAMPVNDATPCEWFGEARDLIAARAKWHVALHVLKDKDLASAMSVAEGDALSTLRGNANVAASSGVVAAYDL